MNVNKHNLAMSLLVTHTVTVSYEELRATPKADDKWVYKLRPGAKSYDFCLRPGQENSIEPGDTLLVGSANGEFAHVQVVSVQSADLDVSATYNYKFIHSLVPRDPNKEVHAKLAKIKAKMNSAQRMNAQAQALTMLGFTKEDLLSVTND